MLFRQCARTLQKLPRVTEPLNGKINFNYRFSTKRSKPTKDDAYSARVVNENLKFVGSTHEINMYVFYPKVNAGKGAYFEINKFGIVLSLVFVGRADKSLQGEQLKAMIHEQWQNRKSINFKFIELSQILSITEDEPLSQKIQIPNWNNSSSKLLTLTPDKKRKVWTVGLKELGPNSDPSEISTELNFIEFELMQFLIKESLFDLSGMRLMLDLKREEELQKLTRSKDKMNDEQDLLAEYDKKDVLV